MKIEISVIIPVYDNFKLLKRAISSVLKQSFKKFEIIVILDNPIKENLLKLKKIILDNQKIKLITNNKNIGAGLSRNKGIKIAKGKYIAFLDSDDLWHKNKLKFQLDYMNKYQLLISHTSYNIINESGKKISSRKSKKKLHYKDILNSCDIGLSTVMINLNFLNKNNFKFPKIKTKEDYVLWLKILKKTSFIKGINKNLTNYRKTKNSLSSSSLVNIINGYKVYRDYMKMGIIESLYRLLILSTNYLKKKIINDI